MKERFTFPLCRQLAVLVFLLAFSTLKAQTGLINDDFSTGNAYNWAAASLGSTSQVQNGKLVVTYPPPSGGKYRADLKKNGGVVFHAGAYPIIAIKMNKPPRCNYFFDTNLGSFNASNNNGTKIVTESGNVYYWDLSTGKLGTTVLSRTEPTTLSAFQLKVADIVLTDEEVAANKTNYQVEWVKSFASVDALRSFLNPSGTGNPVFEFSGAFSHPGLLHNATDLNRMKDLITRKVARPYQSYQKLISSDKASATYQMRGPYSAITRDQTLTIDGVGGGAVKNNVESDFLAAYYNALQYTITGNQAHALKATQIIDAYSAKTTSVIGADKELNGLYGFILANAAEIMRSAYPAWPADKVQQCQNMLKSVFYPVVQNFRPCGHGNWDIICMKALMGIAIFSDDVPKFNKAVNYFYYGEGNGSIKNYVLTEAGQLQESNRDQPHTMLALGSLAELAEMALKQGVDLYSANNNAILRGYEYTAKYNLGFDVPYQTSYDYCEVNYQDYTPASISDKGRGELRPVFEIAYNHYVFRKGLSMPQTLSVLGVTGPEGAPAGADNPGYGSLFFYLNSEQDYSYPNAGLINDDFTATAGLWKTATAGSVATVENGELKVTTVMQSNGKGRGDIQSGVTALHPSNYPILAVKMKKPATCNFIFDTNLGSYGNGANKWTGKVGEDIYYYDLTKTGFGSAGTIIPASTSTSFSVFQFKVADIASGESSYTVDWVKTVKTLADLVALDPNTGLINDNFTSTAEGWNAVTSGASVTVDKGNLRVKLAKQTNGSYRGDIRRTAGATLYPENYPILAVKLKKPVVANITFDTNLGSFGNGSNKWTGKMGEDIYYFDLTKSGFGTAGLLTRPTALTTFQFKIADITSGELDYQVDWVKTVKTLAELQQFIAPAYQRIAFLPLDSMAVDHPDFSPAVASSGLPVTYSSSDTSVATILNGKVHITGGGRAIITAIQPGNAGYYAADPVSRELNVFVPPLILTKNARLELDETGLAVLNPAHIDSGSISYSGLLHLQLNRTSFSCADIGTEVPVLLTGTDEKGHSRSATAKVVVVDRIAPRLQIPEDQTFCYNEAGYSLSLLQASDNCGIDSIWYRITGATERSGSNTDASGAFNPGVSIVTWQVKDLSGNMSAGTTKVTINSPLSVSIPDVYAINPAVDEKNTLYLGYGPGSFTLNAVVQGGTAPYSYSWSNGLLSSSIVADREGAYSVTITDAKGCQATTSLAIKVLDVRCGNNNDKVLICHNGNAICVSSSAVNAHLSHGDKLGGCVNSNHLATVAESKVKDDVKKERLLIYPNPVTNSLFIKGNGLGSGARIKIFDLSGKEMVSLPINNEGRSVDVGSWANGAYVVRIINGGEVLTSKFIKN